MKQKEIFWFVGTLLSALILSLIFLGLKGLQTSTLDINIHDTYFVITLFPASILFTTLTFFFVYFVRMLRGSFTNLIVDYIFLVTSIILLILLSKLIGVLGGVSHFIGMAERLSPNEEIAIIEKNWAKNFTTILLLIQITLLVLLGFCALKTGTHYKKMK